MDWLFYAYLDFLRNGAELNLLLTLRQQLAAHMNHHQQYHGLKSPIHFLKV